MLKSTRIENAKFVMSKDELTYAEVIEDFKNASEIHILTYNISRDKSNLLEELKKCDKDTEICIVSNIPGRWEKYFGEWYKNKARKNISLYKSRLSPEKIAEKAEVYFCFSNHAKIVMTNNIAYIGSSNFSEESADNFESGFISKDADFIEFLEEEIFPWIIESSSEYKTDDKNTKDLDFERKHKEDLQRIRGFRLLDEDFMSKVFEDKDCTEFLLQIILNRTDLKVLRVHGQYDIRNLQGRSVRLDILAVDTEERVYNIEIQRSDKDAVVKRARYNSSLIDANITEPGEKYENLCESYIIFITENDIMKAGLPIYHVDRIVKETGELFGDESHIIYVNSQIKDESALGKLMHDFSCTDAKDMNYKILADRVRYFKEDEKGVATMCRAMEEMRNETAHEKAVQIAKRMLKSGKLSYEEIAEFAELTVEEVKALDEKVIA